MSISDIIQNFTTGSVVFLGLTYIIGGLIVNLNLTRRGLVEFQILKVKYLVVGIVFLLHSIGVFTFACLPAVFLLLGANNPLLLQGINVVSMLSAGSLILIWSRYPSNTKSWLSKWWFWFAASTIGAIFPMMALLRQLIQVNTQTMWIIFSGQAVLTGTLTFLAQIYHYSAFYYGRSSGMGALDPIGVFIPTRIRLACDEKELRLLERLGVAIIQEGVTGDLYLIDETDQHYIVGFQREAGSDENTLKINKNAVKAILYRPDPTRAHKKEPSPKTPPSAEKLEKKRP